MSLMKNIYKSSDAPSLCVPKPHSRVKASSRNPPAVKCDRVDLLLVPSEYPQALARIDIPHLPHKLASDETNR